MSITIDPTTGRGELTQNYGSSTQKSAHHPGSGQGHHPGFQPGHHPGSGHGHGSHRIHITYLDPHTGLPIPTVEHHTYRHLPPQGYFGLHLVNLDPQGTAHGDPNATTSHHTRRSRHPSAHHSTHHSSTHHSSHSGHHSTHHSSHSGHHSSRASHRTTITRAINHQPRHAHLITAHTTRKAGRTLKHHKHPAKDHKTITLAELGPHWIVTTFIAPPKNHTHHTKPTTPKRTPLKQSAGPKHTTVRAAHHPATPAPKAPHAPKPYRPPAGFATTIRKGLHAARTSLLPRPVTTAHPGSGKVNFGPHPINEGKGHSSHTPIHKEKP